MHKHWNNRNTVGHNVNQPQVDQWGRPIQQPQVDQWGRPIQQAIPQAIPQMMTQPQVDQWGRPVQHPTPQVDQYGRPIGNGSFGDNINQPSNGYGNTNNVGFGSPEQVSSPRNGIYRIKKTRHATRAKGYAPVTTQPVVTEDVPVVNNLKSNIVVEYGIEHIVAHTDQNESIDIYKGKSNLKEGVNMINLDEGNTIPVPDCNINGDYTYAKLINALYEGEATIAYCLGTAEYTYSVNGNVDADMTKSVKSTKLKPSVLLCNKLLTTYVNSLLEACDVTVTIDNAAEDIDELIKYIKDIRTESLAKYIEDSYAKIVEGISSTTSEKEEVLTIPITYIVSAIANELEEVSVGGVATLSNESAPVTLSSVVNVLEQEDGRIMQLLTDDVKYIVTSNMDNTKLAFVAIV